MANVQPTAVQNKQNSTNTNQEPLTPITMLLRFLYTGTSDGSIPVKIATNLENIENTLSCVIDMATQRALLPVSTIRKVYQGKMYIRVDEVLIALAYCAKQTHSEELRMLANNEALTLISDQDDFLLFISYCAKISTVLRGPQHLNFGHGMCRLVEKWYGKFSNLDLANMFGEHRSLHGWSHQSVVQKAHMRTKKRTLFEVPASTETVSASSSTAQSTIGDVLAISNVGSATAGTSSSNAQLASATDEDDREQVFQFVFCKGGQEYLQYLEDKSELGPGAQRLKDIQILKTNENIDSAVQSIRRHKFSVTQIPAHLLEKEKIWETLLPTLSSRTLLLHLNTLKDFGFLNEEGSPFTQKFIEVFGKPNTFKLENVCPIYLYILKQLYQKNVRYLGTKKAEYYEKKVLKRKITKNNVIKNRLNDMFNQALLIAKPAPAKFMVVMDLRRGNANKPVLRNKHINCFEASLLLAYSIFVREKDALVYTFTGTKGQLEPLHHLMPKANFEMAKEVIDLQSVSHTYQSLTKPIAEATTMKKKIDMFVVIVDSVARFCRQGQVPIEEFKAYRAKFNDRAKYVVVNLTRPTPDLKIPQIDGMKGFFEICGFNQDTPKILYALATHCFT
ncbi:uncharacterized protein LOC129568332 [Sitodiplosis mosellana]|uniref:uncharacterized protein LOC129568332 n=1 Tax=Sitodiplosis mosellana TaxID=263140 RepID=UPI0024448BC7|nr:uncharacterized protein LOC129568332 [Sitodiplosis mosellana]XP_055302000.1 uncharacterized protein LOC129568332 [Sitodiplosis mosellana]XP_055302001.1 uncharacterized protein LOC129568332 [Sitodiplosis mosellana]XP_055302002.1 uncharacterized protein LOC129568332 [Sitodiplosis mosellana]